MCSFQHAGSATAVVGNLANSIANCQPNSAHNICACATVYSDGLPWPRDKEKSMAHLRHVLRG